MHDPIASIVENVREIGLPCSSWPLIRALPHAPKANEAWLNSKIKLSVSRKLQKADAHTIPTKAAVGKILVNPRDQYTDIHPISRIGPCKEYTSHLKEEYKLIGAKQIAVALSTPTKGLFRMTPNMNANTTVSPCAQWDIHINV